MKADPVNVASAAYGTRVAPENGSSRYIKNQLQRRSRLPTYQKSERSPCRPPPSAPGPSRPRKPSRPDQRRARAGGGPRVGAG
jgi:hypothetical protein